MLGHCWVRTEDAASRGASSLLVSSPHSAVLHRRPEVCNPLVSTHAIEVGVGVVVGVVVSRVDRGFKHIAPDTASSRHCKEVGAVGTAFHVDRSDCCDKL